MHISVLVLLGGQKRALDLPELNLQAVVSVARYECWELNSVLYKSSKWS